MGEISYSNKFATIWVRRLSKLLVISTLLLIFAGALVKSHEVGLSVPDWPTSYGYQMFSFPLNDMIGGIFYEHGHRMIATVIGLMTLILAFAIYHTDDRLWLKKTAFFALGLVIIQGLFGGLTVLLFLPTPVSVIHAILAQIFLIVTVLIAYGLSKERANRNPNDSIDHKGLRFPAYLVAGFVFIQLIIGALMRHTQSGLAIPDFPLSGGYIIPAFNQEMLNSIQSMQFESGLPFVTLSQIIIHYLHRMGALAVAISIGWLTLKIIQSKISNERLYRSIGFLITLLIIQIILGAFTIWSIKEPFITSIHVVNGAVILGVSTLLILRVSPVKLSW
ncbi:MAG: COX15/CtaA family protein [Candidatus Neomarinimicrobiota bacterium]